MDRLDEYLDVCPCDHLPMLCRSLTFSNAVFRAGELYDRVVEKSLSPEQHFSEYDAARILRNILEAIAYCHDEKNICHRDLKVENFLLLNERDDSPVKIIDFGLSRFNPDNLMTTRVRRGFEN
jgi:serine/threonine protein kinase